MRTRASLLARARTLLHAPDRRARAPETTDLAQTRTRIAYMRECAHTAYGSSSSRLLSHHARLCALHICVSARLRPFAFMCLILHLHIDG
eukprot:1877311-Pleurochrysis_carterae.AAC.3